MINGGMMRGGCVWIYMGVLTAMLCLAGAPVAAQGGAHVLERMDLEAWLDGLVPQSLTDGQVAGGVVVVVKDGQVLLEKGYGYADVKNRTPVDPERTLFRFGSVSKVFTWVAVMQLVEQGKINLDRDIDDYLDFRVPSLGKPITMRHLMTHRAGFGEAVRGLMHFYPSSAAASKSLESYLKSTLPERIFKPDTLSAYSNYGAALAGYIVQRVSGEEFSEYVERHIFQPLGMQHSTFRQPLPPGWAAGLSQGYKTVTTQPFEFELCGPSPAGALSSTGADTARFLIAMLQAERTGGGLMRPQTAQLWYRSVSQAIAPLNGMMLGLGDASRNGRRVLNHGGDTEVFHSDLYFLPDEGVGLFMVVNSSGEQGAGQDLLPVVYRQFMDRYFPAPLPVEPTLASATEHGRQIVAAGPYQSTRRAESTFVDLLSLLEQQQPRLNDDDTLVLPSEAAPNGQPLTWHEVAPYVWREVGGRRRLAARVIDGNVVALGVEPTASDTLLQPVPLARAASWNLPVFGTAVAVVLLTLVGWPVSALIRRHYGRPRVLPEVLRRSYRLAYAGAAVIIVFLLGWLLILQAGMGNLALFDAPLDPWITLVQWVGWLGVAGAVATVRHVWLCIGRCGKWSITWAIVLAVSCGALVRFAFTFSLLTSSLRY